VDSGLIKRYLAATKVIRSPQSPLATFGATRIRYHLVSPIEDLPNRTRLREGEVISEKPRILTPEAFLERFKGFGTEATEFADWLSSQYRDLLRTLEYNFKNTGLKTRVLSEPPAQVADRIAEEIDASKSGPQALLACPDGAWSLSLMKFTLDESAKSFPTHVRDLERRGLFNPEKHAAGKRDREIESLFTAAGAGDVEARDRLGKKLREYGLFQEYEGRFLSLF
jgi:hypothetical protein